MTLSRSALIVLIGAAVVVLGSFLAWRSWSGEGLAESVGGMDANGSITLIVGLAAGAFVVFLKERARMIAVVVSGVIIVLVAISGMFEVGRAADELGELSGADVSVGIGIGLWLVLLGGIAVLAGGFAWDAE